MRQRWEQKYFKNEVLSSRLVAILTPLARIVTQPDVDAEVWKQVTGGNIQ